MTPVLKLGHHTPTIVALAFAAWLLWPASLWGWSTFTVVQGSSMEPTYHSGDMLYVRSFDDIASSGAPSIDDIAVYRVPDGEAGEGSYVVHRIIDLEGTWSEPLYVLQGDNRDQPDQAMPADNDLIGRPIVNLGPWPTRVLGVLPLLLAAVIGIAFAWYLWPAPLPPTPPSANEAEPDLSPEREPADLTS